MTGEHDRSKSELIHEGQYFCQKKNILVMSVNFYCFDDVIPILSHY